MNWTWDQWKAAGKHALSFAAGLVASAVAFGLLTQGQGTEVTNDLNSIANGVGEVIKGVTGLLAILTPIYTAWKAAHNASPDERAKAVAASGSLVVAPSNGNGAKIAQQIATIPGVSQVVATPEIAQAVPSDKVVSK